MKREATSYTVGQVSHLAGVTVRTLHHYDQIGLLTPSGRSDSGYRRYDDSDLGRLQQIRLYRELGFSLEEIATILDDPGADAALHLRRQHELLIGRIARLRMMVGAVERELEAQQTGMSLTPEERFEVWGDFNPDDHAEEAEQRWGGTEPYRESQRRAARHTKDDWLAVKAEAGDIYRRLIEAMRSGERAQDETAMDLAEEHRRHLTRWFYDCGYDIHKGLGEMYAGDPRFTATYEKMAEGLATYVRDAIQANAARAEAT
jgi:DNA-binding transcriptional MerR regulator